jgi:calcium/calmodulin-dependent protein kinase I
VKIADFGTSKRRQAEVTSLHTLQQGTFGYAAPEALGFSPNAANTSYTSSVDMWSLGAVAYKILTHTVPFLNIADMFKYVTGALPFPTELLNIHNVSEPGCDFITKLMSSTAEQRPSATSAMEHPWMLLTVDVDLLEDQA